MTNNDLPNTSTPFGRRQADAERRIETVGGSVTADEKVDILTALQQSGFANQSHGVRAVLMAFADSATVRDAIAKALSPAA